MASLPSRHPGGAKLIKSGNLFLELDVDQSPFRSPQKRIHSSTGFTLVEMMIVLAILAILTTIAVPLLKDYIDRAKIARARGDIDKIHKAMVLLEADTGQWPGHQTTSGITTSGSNEIWDFSVPSAGLVATDGKFPNWNGPYLSSIPKDPWGNNYFLDTDYQVKSQNRVALGSFGPNGVGPNLYDKDDVIKLIY